MSPLMSLWAFPERRTTSGKKHCNSSAITASATCMYLATAREGPRAASMADQIGTDIKTQRNKELIQLTRVQREDFLPSQIGSESQVQWESTRDNHGQLVAYGYTENYARVAIQVEDGHSVTNTIRTCLVGELNDSGQHLWATPILQQVAL